MAPVIIHCVLAILGIRLGLYCVMAWLRLRQKHTVAGSSATGLERFFLFGLPVLVALLAVLVVNSGLEVIRFLGTPVD